MQVCDAVREEMRMLRSVELEQAGWMNTLDWFSPLNIFWDSFHGHEKRRIGTMIGKMKERPSRGTLYFYTVWIRHIGSAFIRSFIINPSHPLSKVYIQLNWQWPMFLTVFLHWTAYKLITSQWFKHHELYLAGREMSCRQTVTYFHILTSTKYFGAYILSPDTYMSCIKGSGYKAHGL